MFTLIGVGLIVLVGIGFGVTRSQSRTDQDPPSGEPAGTEISCEDACRRWESSRTALCLARTEEELVQNQLDNLRRQRNNEIAIATAAAATAAALKLAGDIAAASVIGLPLAPALWAAAAVALVLAAMSTAAATVLMGAIAAAMLDLADKQSVRRSWEVRVADDRLLVLRTCSPEDSEACFARPAPC